MDSSRHRTPTARQWRCLGMVLLSLTVYGSIIPLRYTPVPFSQAVDQFRNIGFTDPRQTEPRADWVVNMVQYAAVTFCVMAGLAADRGRKVALVMASLVVPVGWAVALTTEFLQVYFPPRTVSFNDILMESLGVVLGAAVWLAAGQVLVSWLRRFWNTRGLTGLASQVLPLYLGLLLAVQLMPFDVVLSRAELAEKYRQGRITLVPFGDLSAGEPWPLLHLFKNMLAYLPLGVILALRPGRAARDWGVVVAWGLGLTALVEALKLVVYSRYCDVTGVLTGTAAVLGGWWATRRLLARDEGGRLARMWESLHRRLAAWGPWEWGGLALMWAAVLVAVNWYPYDFTSDPARFLASDPDLSDENTTVVGLRRMSWAPFVDYYWGSRYQTLDQVVRRVAAFAPLGICLALAWRRRQQAALLTVAAALGLGAAIGLGQYFIPQRHPSVTSLLIHVVGAWLGYRLTRHMLRALADVETQAPRRRRTRKAPRWTTVPATGPAWEWVPSGEASDDLPSWGDAPRPRYAHPAETERSNLLALIFLLPEWARMLLICAAVAGAAIGAALLLARTGS